MVVGRHQACNVSHHQIGLVLIIAVRLALLPCKVEGLPNANSHRHPAQAWPIFENAIVSVDGNRYHGALCRCQVSDTGLGLVSAPRGLPWA